MGQPIRYHDEGRSADRNPADEALHASEERFRILFETMGEGYCVIEVIFDEANKPIDYRFVETNPAFERQTGIKDAKGRRMREIAPDLEQHWFDFYGQIALTGETRRVENPAAALGRWYDVSAFRVGAPELRHVGVVFNDITDRKRIEEMTRFVAGVSAALAELTDPESTLQKVASLVVPPFADWCAVDMVDPGGRLRRVAIIHADPVKLGAYRDLLERYPPRTEDPHSIPHVLATGEPDLLEVIPDSVLDAAAHDEAHLRLLKAMGLKSHILVPIRAHGRTLGVLTFITAESGRRYTPADLVVARDIAHRAAVAIRNAELYQALQDADRRKDEFLATLAHELRNPLAPIRNGLEVMKLASDNREAVERSRAMMERQLGQLVRLVDDLMDVSRINQGKLELRMERVELAAVLNSAVETSRPLIEQAGHELTVVLPHEPVVIYADLTRLAQAFLNLLNNAAKYSDGAGRISVTAERQGKDVVVSVRDAGIGIAAEQLPGIFDLFSQVDRSLEKSQGGLGIGLTLVRRLVERHGGTVEARSDGAGKGSEFVVRLPVFVAASAPTATVDDRAPASPGKSFRIMVVEDNRDGAESLAAMLSIMGNETRTAYDGLDGVRAVEEFRPDVVLLDIGLPKLNGYEACRHIRGQPWGKELVLIAVTGWGQDEDRRRSREAGFDHHMVKPVEPHALMKLLAGLRTANS
ncbi:MAG TPA: ATP-binding protein [Candidatus Saccharimonadia bacterium]|nr:ATP-binding protein [Candidatus Saccharimonadia bacterium]